MKNDNAKMNVRESWTKMWKKEVFKNLPFFLK